MDNYATNLKFVRAKYKTVGVVGMNSSGVQEFAKVAWQNPRIMYTAGARSLSNYFIEEIFNTPEAKAQYIEKGIDVSDFQLAVESATTGFVPDAYEITKNVIFPHVLSDIVADARATLSNRSEFDLVMIECPVTTLVKYPDLFDAVIVIKRPTDYEEDSWYVQHFLREKEDEDDVGVTFADNQQVGIEYLKVADEMFARIKCDSGIIIENDGTLEEFQEKASLVIDELLQ